MPLERHRAQVTTGLLPRPTEAPDALRAVDRRPPDPWLELEGAVASLSRIVLRGSALAEHPRPPARDDAGLQRVRRLQDGLELTRRALLVAARLEVVPTTHS